MDVDPAVLGGEPADPATGWFSNRKAVSFFFNRQTSLSFIDGCRGACQVPPSIWTQPTDPHIGGIPQASPSEPSPTRGDEALFFLFPPFPKGPAYLFGRDAVLEELLRLTEQPAPVALFGAGGIGKTAIALTLLRHHQIMIRFGNHRYFVRCDDLDNSLVNLPGRLSETIGIPQATDMAQILSHLEASPPCLLVLDGIDSILDPLAPGAAEIAKTIAEFGRCPKMCMVVTSRMDPKIPGFCCREIPTFLETAARNAFHSSCRLGRSAAIDTILAELDFHPLSIVLLASAVSENEWDEPALLEAWDGGNTCILKAPSRESLEDNIESVLRAPTIQELGITARETLEAIADAQGGVKEIYLLSVFPGINGVGDAVDALCKFSLIYRQDGFVKMLAPFRLYFQHTQRATNLGLFLSFPLLFCLEMTFLDGFSVVPDDQPSEHPPVRLDVGNTAKLCL